MTDAERDRFDQLLEEVLHNLPGHVRDLFDEAPLIVEDRPSPELLDEMGLDPLDDTLCGLYTGTPITERSVEDHARAPDCIQIFREGIVLQAGGWEEVVDDDGETIGGENAIADEIHITILHELGHHFGLDEDDLMEIGYE